MLALLFLLRQFVFELSEIRNAADRRIGRGGHLDQVEAVGLGSADGILGLENAELLARGADDDAHFAGADAVVDTNECWINGASVRLVARNGDGCRAGLRNLR